MRSRNSAGLVTKAGVPSFSIMSGGICGITAASATTACGSGPALGQNKTVCDFRMMSSRATQNGCSSPGGRDTINPSVSSSSSPIHTSANESANFQLVALLLSMKGAKASLMIELENVATLPWSTQTRKISKLMVPPDQVATEMTTTRRSRLGSNGGGGVCTTTMLSKRFARA